MGCGASKGDNPADAKIDSEFPPTNLAGFDGVLTEAGEILKDMERLRSEVSEPREKGFKLSHVYKMRIAKYTDVIQVMLWALSVDGKGKISACDAKVIKEKPYLKIETSKVSHETAELYESYSSYMLVLDTVAPGVKANMEKLKGLQDKIKGAMEGAKDEITKGPMGFAEKAKAVMGLAKNFGKFGKEMAKCGALVSLLADAGNDLKEFVPNLPNQIKDADVTGAKAVAAKHTTLGHIFDNYIIGERKKEHVGKPSTGAAAPAAGGAKPAAAGAAPAKK